MAAERERAPRGKPGGRPALQRPLDSQGELSTVRPAAANRQNAVSQLVSFGLLHDLDLTSPATIISFLTDVSCTVTPATLGLYAHAITEFMSIRYGIDLSAMPQLSHLPLRPPKPPKIDWVGRPEKSVLQRQRDRDNAVLAPSFVWDEITHPNTKRRAFSFLLLFSFGRVSDISQVSAERVSLPDPYTRTFLPTMTFNGEPMQWLTINLWGLTKVSSGSNYTTTLRNDHLILLPLPTSVAQVLLTADKPLPTPRYKVPSRHFKKSMATWLDVVLAHVVTNPTPQLPPILSLSAEKIIPLRERLLRHAGRATSNAYRATVSLELDALHQGLIPVFYGFTDLFQSFRPVQG